jgi:probable F420-dependent oxidoreductase
MAETNHGILRNPTMKIGFSLPQFGGQALQAALIPAYARELEEAGADSLWVGDRLIAPASPTIGYSGTDTIPAYFNSSLDPFVTLTLAAGATERVRLGSSVIIAPLYQPALLARLLSSIDIASNGRLIAGFGIGWSPEEYQAAAVPFDHRGGRLEETLDALELIWTTDQPAYSGRYVTVPEFHSALNSPQRPHPPIYISAFSDSALDRVVRRAAGWLPVLHVGGPVNIDVLLAVRANLHRLAEEAGRDPSTIDVILRVGSGNASLAQKAAAALEAVDKLGLEEFFFDLGDPNETVESALEQAHELLKLVNAG